MDELGNRNGNFYTSGCAKCKFPLMQKRKGKEEKMHGKTMQTIGHQFC